MWKKAALVLLYISYAVILTIVLLVVRFPKDTFLSYADTVVEKQLPGVKCSISDAAYLYPFSIRFDTIRLSTPLEVLNILVDSARVTPDFKQPLTNYSIVFTMYGGNAESEVILNRENGAIELPDLRIAGVDLERLEVLKRLDREVAGVLSFSGRAGWDPGNQPHGNISGTTLITAFRLLLKRPILQSDAVVFDEISAATRLEGGEILVSAGKASGPLFTTSFSGRVQPMPRWQESELEISGDLVPEQNYLEQNRQVARAVALLFQKYQNNAIPYTVRGSVGEPAFQFGKGL